MCHNCTHRGQHTNRHTPHPSASKITVYVCTISPSACLAHRSSVRWRQERALRATHTPCGCNFELALPKRAWQDDTDSTKCEQRKCLAYQEHNDSTKDATTSPPQTRRHRGRPHPLAARGLATTSTISQSCEGHQKLETLFPTRQPTRAFNCIAWAFNCCEQRAALGAVNVDERFAQYAHTIQPRSTYT